MSSMELESKVNELRELKRMADELACEITAIEDSIKAEMIARSVDEIRGNTYKISWKPVTSTRLDGKALKAAAPSIWEQLTKTTTSKRFSIA